VLKHGVGELTLLRPPTGSGEDHRAYSHKVLPFPGTMPCRYESENEAALPDSLTSNLHSFLPTGKDVVVYAGRILSGKADRVPAVIMEAVVGQRGVGTVVHVDPAAVREGDHAMGTGEGCACSDGYSGPSSPP